MHRRALVVAAVAVAVAAGCSSGNTGTVTGGIIPCAALFYSGEPHYAAGTVTVLEGQVHWRSTGPGTSEEVLPTTVVVGEQVGVDASYDFILGPGDYVLRARFPPPSFPVPSGSVIEPWVAVTVHAGQTEHIDIPNMCK
jgi:hypothetical protein